MSSWACARHWIDGEWVGTAHETESVDPATGDTIGIFSEAGGAEAARAVAAAVTSFRSTDWRGDRRLRAKALNEMANRFEARSDDLVGILKLENGKVEAEARFEVGMVPSKLRYYAALALTDYGRAVEVAPGRYATTLREPIGVAGIIAPWNSPVGPLHPIPGSRACGRMHGCRQVARPSGADDGSNVRGVFRGDVPSAWSD